MNAKFSDLVGKVILKIDGDKNSDVLVFHCQDGSEYKMYHEQDCCESVTIEDIDGDMSRLLGLPITIAEESSSGGNVGQYGDTCTWTFYKLGNVIDTVTIRWYGESNGYYSEGVSFYMTKKPNQEAKVKVDNDTIVKAVEEKIADLWKGVYRDPDSVKVRIGKYNGETGVFIRAEASYNAPALTFAQLLKLSEIFGTTRIDNVDDFAYSGCDTCDYGSSYGWEIVILPPSKEQKAITMSSHGYMIIED